MKSEIGNVQSKYGSRGKCSFSIEVSHVGLNKYRLIQGSSLETIQKKANLQANEWDNKWEKLKNCSDKKQEAYFLTKEAQNLIDEYKSILKCGLLNIDFSLNKYKKVSNFNEPKPLPLPQPTKPILKEIPAEPTIPPIKIKNLNFFLGLIPWVRRRAIKKQHEVLLDHDLNKEIAYKKWESEKITIENENAEIIKNYESLVISTIKKNEKMLGDWCQRIKEYEKNLKRINEPIEALRIAYSLMKPDAIIDFFTILLNDSDYPVNFKKEFEIEYIEDTKTLLVNYFLPEPSIVPTLKEVRYVQTRQEFTEYHITASQHCNLYDEVLYQISFRTLHEIFKADKIESVQSIVFNGWTCSINRSTGKEETACIMSIHVQRTEFKEINLFNIDPKLCFKSLKGIGCSKLSSLVGISPIQQVLKPDSRFVQSYDVAYSLNEGFNLASMAWEDFEHLIRELFEKEFASVGGEVRVTQASRDGGVDAIIFNPDPIHGGKIVIQAKRYTNTVGVSAVRDLYGTVVNEGADRGILVTTSDFGPDSHNFAKGKQLTLFNGGNLLILLEKHGHKARIDLKEAKGSI